jgi:hypothetical protein
MKRTKP